MMEKDLDIEKSLEQALRLMEERTEASEETVEGVQGDEEAMQAYEALRLYRKGMERKHVKVPDADKEWARMQERVRRPSLLRRSFFIGGAIGIAASLLLAVLFVWMRGDVEEPPIMAFQASEDEQSVVLDIGRGGRVTLGQAASEQLTQLPEAVQQTDSATIAYGVAQADIPIEMHKLSTPRGTDFKVILADGSIVWLNAESRLEYPSRFEGNERRVRLYGEAYFQVAPDEAHPFVVETDHVQTHVLGTEFNIRGYRQSDSHVTLVKGSVAVTGLHSGTTIQMRPGEDAALQSDGSFAVQKVDTDVYVYWKEGFFFFDDTPLLDIMQDLGRWYNVDIIFLSSKSMSHRLHYFCERSAGVETAVKQLNMLQKVKARFENGTIYIE